MIDELENAFLMFRNNYSLEDSRDGGVLEISIDGGPFQDILAAAGSFLQGGYNGTVSNCCGNPLAGCQAWTGNSGGFITTAVGVGFQGHGTVLRWRMGSDSHFNGQGWRIDSVQMICERPTPTSTPTPTLTPTATATATEPPPSPTATPTVTPTITPPSPSPSPTIIDTPTPTPIPTRVTPTPRPRPTPRLRT